MATMEYYQNQNPYAQNGQFAYGTSEAAAEQGARYNFGSASIYVGDLDPSVTEQELLDLFLTIGPVASVRIIANRVVPTAQNYGYVNFINREDAEKAMTTHKFTEIKGVPCRIMWSQRDNALRSSVSANVFVRGLTPTADNKKIEAAFAPHGTVASCKVVYDEHGISKGYGFVQFENEADALALLAKTTSLTIDGSVAEISKFVPRNSSRDDANAASVGENLTNLFIKNIPDAFDGDDLRSLFSVFGHITSAVVMKDPATGFSRRYGFVNFANPEDADKAIAEMDGHKIESNRLIVNRAQHKRQPTGYGNRGGYGFDMTLPMPQLRPRHQQAPTQALNVYVKHLDLSTDEEALTDAFKQFGNIISAKIVRDATGISRGFGFIVFSTAEEASAAVSQMNGKHIGAQQVYVALSHHNHGERSSSREPRSPYHQDYYGYGGYGQGYAMPFMPYYPQGYAPYGQAGYEQFQWPANAAPYTFNAAPFVPGAAAYNPGVTQYVAPSLPKLTQQVLESIPEDQRKQKLGDSVYANIEVTFGPSKLVGKVTGLILENDNDKILALLENPASFKSAVEEAFKRVEGSE